MIKLERSMGFARTQEGTCMSQQSLPDPRGLGEKPPFPAQSQTYPGIESRMEPQPDFGEASYRGSGKLTDQVALITGGDSGIGRAVALAFAREGADVLISYLNEDEDAQETVRVVTESGRKAVAVAGDIQSEAHCVSLVEQAVEHFGRLDILVNNAAFQNTIESIQDLTSDDWDRAFRTNIYAMFYLSKIALKHLPEGGTIINTTSIQAYQPSASLLHYATTKGAIVTFTKALSEEALKQGVRVNAVAPGPVWTPLITSTIPAEQHTGFGGQNPMGRPAQPAELAPAYVFLASRDSTFIAGEIIGVTGGTPLS
jgi:NAD(P)-dependent dehydrogenase (short-subunit alcohol dehydrogenase family)